MDSTVQTVSRDINKEAMLTNAKLFVAMGLTWIGEFVTGLYERNSAACLKDPDTCVHPAVKMMVNCMNIFLVIVLSSLELHKRGPLLPCGLASPVLLPRQMAHRLSKLVGPPKLLFLRMLEAIK